MLVDLPTLVLRCNCNQEKKSLTHACKVSKQTGLNYISCPQGSVKHRQPCSAIIRDLNINRMEAIQSATEPITSAQPWPERMQRNYKH